MSKLLHRRQADPDNHGFTINKKNIYDLEGGKCRLKTTELFFF